MNSSGFGWEPLLVADAKGRSLKAALFTTYDRADERLLAEHLLPMLLNLSPGPNGEGTEQQYFLVELHERLKELHDRIVVVSSMAREAQEEPRIPEEGDSRPYLWLWRSIRSLAVGKKRKAVQHAKLWLLHWGAADDGIEHLEIVVSSANLTYAACKGQLQAVWRVCIPLASQRSETRMRAWGILPLFLRRLAESAGQDERLTPFVDLLARADCPYGVTFVASVPGTYSRRELRSTPWGAAGLGRIVPPGRGVVRMSILSPFVGSWGPNDLKVWCGWFEGLSTSLRMVWVQKRHPWAKRWILPEATLDSFIKVGARLLRLRHAPDEHMATDAFHQQHRAADDRWSHAKVYSLMRGAARSLLITSANFSQAAWGSEGTNGSLTIENFELGVCVRQSEWPFEGLEIFEDVRSAATVPDLPRSGTPAFSWATATWDGSVVSISCRCESGNTLQGEVCGAFEPLRIKTWTIEGEGLIRSASVPWSDSKTPPSLVKLVCNYQTISIVVFDDRPFGDLETVPPEVDIEVGQIIRDELLFEKYGGDVAEDPDTDNPGQPPSGDDQGIDNTSGQGNSDSVPAPDQDGGSTNPTESYSVPAFVAARRHFRLVDNWAVQVKRETKCSTGSFERQMLKRDGGLLIDALARQAGREDKKSSGRGTGARLAGEELALRLKYFPEE